VCSPSKTNTSYRKAKDGFEMTETLCVSGAVKLAAGTNVSTALTAANYTSFINQAEGDVIADTRCNWIDIYGSMNADFKQVLEGATAAKAAIKAVKYDPSQYNSKWEANFIVNVNWAEYKAAIRTLEKSEVITSLGGSLITS
jgi:hypothetical protein